MTTLESTVRESSSLLTTRVVIYDRHRFIIQATASKKSLGCVVSFPSNILLSVNFKFLDLFESFDRHRQNHVFLELESELTKVDRFIAWPKSRMSSKRPKSTLSGRPGQTSESS